MKALPFQEQAVAPTSDAEEKELSDARAKLAELRQTRERLSEELRSLPEVEAELIRGGASDDEILRVGIKQRRLSIQIEQLEPVEDGILIRVEAAEDVLRKRELESLLDSYDLVAEALHQHVSTVERHCREINALAGQISMKSRQWQVPLKLHFAPALNMQAFEGLRGHARALRHAAVRRPDDRFRTYTVRFLRSWSAPAGAGYNAGMEAGFRRDIACEIVESGAAEWADPAELPKQLRKRQKPKAESR